MFAPHKHKIEWDVSCLASWMQNMFSLWKTSSQSKKLLKAAAGDLPGCCYEAAQGQLINAMLATLVMTFC